MPGNTGRRFRVPRVKPIGRTTQPCGYWPILWGLVLTAGVGCAATGSRAADLPATSVTAPVKVGPVAVTPTRGKSAGSEEAVQTVSHSEPADHGAKPAAAVQTAEAPSSTGGPAPAMLPAGVAALESDRPLQDMNLGTALSLTTGRNPQVAFANERIHEAFATLAAAKVLWLPTIRPGMGYNTHSGPIQDTTGNTASFNRSSFEAGLGSFAVGAGTPMLPGVWANFQLADAIFQPQIAARTAAARQAGLTAATNDLLLATAVAYMNLLDATEQKAIARETEEHTRGLSELTAEFARTGEGNQADADRMQTELNLRTNDVERADEAAQVASARLAELLHFDPTIPITPQEPTVVPVELVDLTTPVEGLVATGLTRRPELAENQALVGEAVQRLKREKNAPLLPSVLLGASDLGFGGGTGGAATANYGNRVDADAIAYWQVRNFGLGEKAARDQAQARLQQAQYQQIQLMDRVSREVTEAYAQARARKRQIATAEQGVAAATRSYARNFERIREGQGLPLEVLQSLQALDQSRREYLRTLVDYTTAQFRLHRAIGWPTG